MTRPCALSPRHARGGCWPFRPALGAQCGRLQGEPCGARGPRLSFVHDNGGLSVKLAIAFALGAALAATSAEASIRWRWTCTGPAFEAKGFLTTGDAPDADGYYPIIDVSGEANGVAITALQPAKTAIRGNEGWPVDNLVRSKAPQLSPGGFGFALADGSYANPFYGARFEPPGFLAVLTNPSKGEWREPRVVFDAERAP